MPAGIANPTYRAMGNIFVYSNWLTNDGSVGGGVGFAWIVAQKTWTEIDHFV